MAFWNLDVLKRLFDDDNGKGKGKGPQDDADDGEDDDDTGGGKPGDDEGNDAGDEGDDAGDEGEPGDEGDGEEGDGEGEGEPGSDEGEGGNERGTGGGKPLDPRDFDDLDSLKDEDIRNPDVTVENEEGESSTPTEGDKETKPVIIIDPAEYPVFPVSTEAGNNSTREWQRILKTIRVAGLRLTLRRLMQRSDYSGRESSLREGRLSGRGVARLLNGADNVFERRYEVEGEDVAVSMLIDRSGSMAGAKMEQAATVALLIGETASNAKAKFEVIAFDSSYDGAARMRLEDDLAKETGVDVYNGRGNAWMYADASAVYVCKTFAQPIGHLRRMFSTMRRMANGGTHDASALDWAGKRLLKQSANRKIMFVIADGAGDATETFRYVVDRLEKRGVIVIGIGIGCSPRSFNPRFTHAVCINNSADLCSKAFGLLIGTIAKAKGL